MSKIVIHTEDVNVARYAVSLQLALEADAQAGKPPTIDELIRRFNKAFKEIGKG